MANLSTHADADTGTTLTADGHEITTPGQDEFYGFCHDARECSSLSLKQCGTFVRGWLCLSPFYALLSAIAWYQGGAWQGLGMSCFALLLLVGARHDDRDLARRSAEGRQRPPAGPSWREG